MTFKAQRFTTRMDIRRKIVEILKGATAAEDRVFDTIPHPSQANEWPAIFVYPTAEDYTKLRVANPGVSGQVLRRDLDVAIDIVATDEDQAKLLDLLDTISEQVEDVIAASNDLGELVHDINVNNAKGVYTLEGPQPEGIWTINYAIVYIKKP